MVNGEIGRGGVRALKDPVVRAQKEDKGNVIVLHQLLAEVIALETHERRQNVA